METDVRQFIQRHWELWSRLYPGIKVTTLTPEQKQTIHDRISREFGLTAEETDKIRKSVMNSPDSVLIQPFVDSSPAVENLMVAANRIAVAS